jgi:alkaline phosphatase D
VRIVATETRAHRDEQAGLDGTAPAADPQRTMLGAEQAAWLEGVTSDPEPRWLVLLSGTVLSPLTIEAPQALDDVLPEKYAVVDGRASNSDQWDGYLVERDHVTTALGRRGGRSIVLSGDIHSSWAIEGPCDPEGARVAVELVCPPAATTPMGQLLPAGVGDRLGPALAHQIEHVRWVDTTHHGFIVLTLTEDESLATWWWVDPEADAATEVGRRWAIPASGGPRLVDPEPPAPAPAPDEEPPSPLSGRAARRWRRLAVAAGAATAAVIGVRQVQRSRR